MSDQQPEPINGETGIPGTGSAASNMSAPAEPVAAAAEVEAPRIAPEQEERSPKADAPKVEAAKVEATKAEATKVEAAKLEAAEVEAPKAEAPKDEAPKVEAAQGRRGKAGRAALPRQGDDHVARRSRGHGCETRGCGG